MQRKGDDEPGIKIQIFDDCHFERTCLFDIKNINRDIDEKHRSNKYNIYKREGHAVQPISAMRMFALHVHQSYILPLMHQSIESPGGGGPGNGRAMPGLSCLVHQNAAPQGGDITN